MKIARVRAASLARGQTIKGLFREVMRARMLWVISGLLIAGAVTFQYLRTTSPSSNVSKVKDAETSNPVSPEQSLAAVSAPSPVIEVRAPVATPSVPPAANAPAITAPKEACDQAARTQAINTRDRAEAGEQERYQKYTQTRRGLKQLLSALTGSITTPPSEAEITKHDAALQKIGNTYQASLRQAHCL